MYFTLLIGRVIFILHFSFFILHSSFLILHFIILHFYLPCVSLFAYKSFLIDAVY
jgi:hypothetical protein